MRRAIAAAHPLWQMLLVLGFSVIVLDVTGVVDQPSGLIWMIAVIASVLGSALGQLSAADLAHPMIPRPARLIRP